jgi:HEAT repeat protein
VALGDFRSAATVGEAALDILSTFLNDGSSSQRRNLVEALGQIGGERVLAPLISALTDADSAVRVAAIEALKETRDSRAVTPLSNCLKDQEPTVRATAATALGSFSGGVASTTLVRGLSDGHWAVRKACVEALGRAQDPNLVAQICPLLQDPDHDVREVACEALGRIADRRAVTALVLALTDSQTMVRQNAAFALRGIDPDWDRFDEARAAIPELQNALKNREYWVRQAAREAIKRIESAEQQAFEEAGANEKLAAELDILSSLLKHSQRDLRQAAVEALGRYGNRQLAPVVAQSLRDPDKWVCASAKSVLEQLGVEVEVTNPVEENVTAPTSLFHAAA